MSEDLTLKLPKDDSKKLSVILATVQNLDARTAVLESRIGKIELHLEKLDTRCNNLDLRLQSLEDKVETRLYDTRPIWEQVVASIAQLQGGQIHLQEGQMQLQESQQRLEQNQLQLQESQRRLEQNQLQLKESQQRLEQNQLQLLESQQRLEQNHVTLHNDCREVKTFLRDIFGRTSVLNDTLLTMRVDYRDIYDRVRGLELKSNEGIS